MMLRRRLVDYHIHSNNSCDGRSPIFKMCQKAVELGIGEIGFSDHIDFEPKDSGFGFFNYQRYTAEIEDAQRFFENKLIIHKGIEIDYQHYFEEDIRTRLRNMRFDYIIGSIHYLNHELIDSKMLAEKDVNEVYNAYFDEVIHSIRSGLFSVVGHFDLVSRYNNKSKRARDTDYWLEVESILREIIRRRMYLELNAKGLRGEGNIIVPSKEILEKYIDSGGNRFSVGSDAHSADEVGCGIREMLSSLTGFGSKVELLFES
ncbi:MAG: histidinol-phosphatase family [Thermoproteota archaeon]|nr:histidinol-phosphatase family [Thermoproteota archaeon]